MSDASVRAMSQGQSLGPVPAVGEGAPRSGMPPLCPSFWAMTQGLSLGPVQNGQAEGGR